MQIHSSTACDNKIDWSFSSQASTGKGKCFLLKKIIRFVSPFRRFQLTRRAVCSRVVDSHQMRKLGFHFDYFCKLLFWNNIRNCCTKYAAMCGCLQKETFHRHVSLKAFSLGAWSAFLRCKAKLFRNYILIFLLSTEGLPDEEIYGFWWAQSNEISALKFTIPISLLASLTFS